MREATGRKACRPRPTQHDRPQNRRAVTHARLPGKYAVCAGNQDVKVAGFPGGTVDEAELTVVAVSRSLLYGLEMAAEVLGISLRSPP